MTSDNDGRAIAAPQSDADVRARASEMLWAVLDGTALAPGAAFFPALVNRLAAALAVQALTLSVATTRGLCVAAFSAGLATGIRSQVAWLTLPLLALRAVGAWGSRLAIKNTA